MTWPNSDAGHLIVSSSQMRKIEEQLFSCGMPVEALMEKVGLKMTSWILNNLQVIKNGVVILVGPGHNGGDGLVLARELFLSGVDVSLWCPFPIKKSLTAKHLSYCISIGITKLASPPDASEKVLWIDALFGLGQTKSIPKEIGLLFQKRNELRPRELISLDVPSGICSDHGKPFKNGAAKASYTLTVGFIKTGLLQDIAMPYVGHLIRIDIGIPDIAIKSLAKSLPLQISPKDIHSFELPSISVNSNKYQRGRLMICAGSQKYRGAALLALRGAIASGVGSIQAVLQQNICDQLWKLIPEVVFQSYSDKEEKEIYIGKCLSKIRLDKIDSLLIGPGLDYANEKWEDFSPALEDFPGLLVLDADGLNRLSHSQEGWKWFHKRKGPTWITPHLNEFCRLFPEIDIDYPLNAARIAADLSRVGILLKGAHSVIAAPGGSVWQLANTSGLVARTGLGDVLAGFVAGIGALGLSSDQKIGFDLFAFSVLVHAYAAASCEDGTSAALISKTLEKTFNDIQVENVRNDTYRRLK
ncbi:MULTISPECIES: bifunctional ADP-dependent NAD(P)H-hydrate dehydratase/NAD(P)H-hydrate epimerase [unclassified Prochlorococcus]|uniref:bifunctional ADP-dependent NAD(P)H-hydrate dehydratase/NAD(P)H-hydrate epimerase n=1 Tax=unclassified Prochlorococcus TaxID=2627481 RepID=UPI0005338A80|nr:MULTISPECIES: bifunctional ADP-dependent NAD(P)H-hydrate dehydratase/NAD(P)H-hydrate epimerase [unclassified Prochlorococcus]KGG16278.1 NAD(P)HX epimerase [Prochlorococcus sp. MIT 0603]KGG17988.1 NAD(P)HX epimerase [Prochlorococcus sp. MIT 0602]